MLNKKNSFTDFIACAEHLIKEGFTSNKKLAILGGSAGGLLVSACLTMRPDLFQAVINKVAFVDVVTTMSDPTVCIAAATTGQAVVGAEDVAVAIEEVEPIHARTQPYHRAPTAAGADI